MVKRITAFFMSLFFSLAVSMPSFASVATPSNAPLIVNPDVMTFSLVQNSVQTVSNTVDTDGLLIQIGGYSTQFGGFRFPNTTVDQDGYFYFDPDSFNYEYDYFSELSVFINKKALPSMGKYRLEIGFKPDISSIDYTNSFSLRSNMPSSNAVTATQFNEVDASYNANGSLYFSCVFDLQSNISQLIFRGNIDQQVAPSGWVSVRWTPLSSSASPDYTSAGKFNIDDVQASIADSSSAIAESTSRIAEVASEIKTTIETSVGNVVSKLDSVMENDRALVEQQISSDQALVEQQISANKANTEEVKSSIEKHGNAIIEGLKGLFIPSDDFFKSYFDDLHGWFSEKLGFLMFPIDLIIEIADIFLGSSDMDCVLTLPSFSIQDYQLWEEYSFNLTEFLEEHFGFLLTAIRFATSVALIIMFVQYCERKWEEVMAN